ncbi:MAG: MFS transporter [Deltaproteobacteria bacterium]|nr:MFS transporter [Deltaproteobacteria bacterium]MBI2347611.1 MFS transporter [Deltaproteobacteria bacterium]MBI2990579.1 MFS transporter [Deltaproteobacteria bacterium]
MLLSPLRHRDFRLFWTGLLLSGIGSQFTTVAMAWQIYELTDSPLQIGLLGLARALPQVVLLLLGGLLADAVNRRKLMMCTQTSLFLVSATLAFLTLAGRTTPLMLYITTVLLALFSSLEGPARNSLVPSLVPREQLAQALALNSSQRHIAVIAGPSLAGLVLALLGPAACYAVDAFSWLVMLLSLSLLQTELQEGKGWGAISINSLREGLAFVWGHAVIFPLMVMDFAANFFGSSKALLPIYARDILSVGPEGLGVLYSASAVGSLLAAAGMSLSGRARHAGLWILVGVGIYGTSTALFAGSRTFWLSVLLLASAGAGDTISAVLRGTINQLSAPDELRGRMVSINSIFTNSGPGLGQFESGLVAAWLGAELSALTGGLATLAILGVVAAAFPNIRRYQIGTGSR